VWRNQGAECECVRLLRRNKQEGVTVFGWMEVDTFCVGCVMEKRTNEMI